MRSLLGVVAAGALALSGCLSETEAAGNGFETVHPGVLTVAIQPYEPYTTYEGDRLTGLDGDIVTAVANKLGLKVKVQVMDFAGMLAAVQSGRSDMTLGGVAWTKDRQKQGLFTDPPYYSPPALAVHNGKTYRTVKDLEGRKLGTVEGYVWVKAIQAVSGAKLSAFPDSVGVLEDLKTGRIDVGFLDPLIILASEYDTPSVGIKTQYMDPPTAAEVAAHPEFEFFRPYMTSFYVSDNCPKLEAAVSAEIRNMYANGEMAKLIEQYGGDPQQFLKPAPDLAATRRGVDRPADWAAPTI